LFYVLNSHWMNTMVRCLVPALALCALALPAAAQMQRNFPQDALRGDITIGLPPAITVNGRSAQLAPGARIRDANNMLALSASIAGARFTAHYTIDTGGQVKDVWILRPDELANNPWPTTTQQAQTWAFDPAAQTWTRR
jgi:hypothetical protein